MAVCREAHLEEKATKTVSSMERALEEEDARHESVEVIQNARIGDYNVGVSEWESNGWNNHWDL